MEERKMFFLSMQLEVWGWFEMQDWGMWLFFLFFGSASQDVTHIFLCSYSDAGKLFMVDTIPKLVKDPAALALRSFTQVCYVT